MSGYRVWYGNSFNETKMKRDLRKDLENGSSSVESKIENYSDLTKEQNSTLEQLWNRVSTA